MNRDLLLRSRRPAGRARGRRETPPRLEQPLQHRVNLTDRPGDGRFDGRHGIVDAAGQVANQLFGPLCLLGCDICRARRVGQTWMSGWRRSDERRARAWRRHRRPAARAHCDDDGRHLDDRHHRDRRRDDAEEHVAHASCSPSPCRCAWRARSNAVVMFSRCRLKISGPVPPPASRGPALPGRGD